MTIGPSFRSHDRFDELPPGIADFQVNCGKL